MKIAMFTQNLNSYMSGGRWYPIYMAYAFAYRGHQVKVVTDSEPSFLDEFKGFHNSENVTFTIAKDFCANKTSCREVGGYDLYIGSPVTGVDYAVTFATMYKKKAVGLCYEPNNWITEESILKRIRNNSQAWHDYQKQAKNCALFICNTELTRDKAKEWIPELGDRVVYLFNGINSVVAEEVQPVPIVNRENAVIYVGRCEEHKNVKEIWNLLGQVENTPKLYVVSGYMTPEFERNMKAQCKHNNIQLDIRKMCSTKEKFELIAKCRALFMPSKFEGFGIPPAEAFYMGTPVIASNLPIFNEIYKYFPHYLTGNEVEDKALVKELLSNESKLFKDLDKAERHVRKFASLENYAEALEKLVLSVAVPNKPVRKARNTPPSKGSETVSVQKGVEPKFTTEKVVSVVMPVYNCNEKYLKVAIESVLAQSHKNTELILVNDDTIKSNCELMEEYAKNNKNVKIVNRKKNGGIAEALMSGIAEASGEYISLVDQDDMLESRAIENSLLQFETENADVVYTNEKQINKDGRVIAETRKPDFSIDFLLRGQYINHLTSYRKSFLEKLLPIRKEYGGSWDYDLLLRAYENGGKFRHVHSFEYMWRIHKDQHGNKAYTYYVQDCAQKAINDFLKRVELDKKIEIYPCDAPGYYDVKYKLDKEEPSVLIIIPTVFPQFLGQCIYNIQKNTKYKNYEIAVIYHEARGKIPENVERFVLDRGYKLYKQTGQFNFCTFNNEVFDDIGLNYDYTVLMNDDIFVGPNWLTELIASFDIYWDDVGIVGAKLLQPYDKMRFSRWPTVWHEEVALLQHAGVELLSDVRASHVYKNKPSNHAAANYLREYKAVTFGLVAIDSECYESVKLNPKYDADLNDMDFCIRASRKSWRILYNPNCLAYHLESITRREQGNAGKRENHNDFAREYRELLKKCEPIRAMHVREAEGL